MQKQVVTVSGQSGAKSGKIPPKIHPKKRDENREQYYRARETGFLIGLTLARKNRMF